MKINNTKKTQSKNLIIPKKSLPTFFGLSSFQILVFFRRGLFYSYFSIYLRNYLGLSVTETTLFATLPMIISVIFQTFVWGKLSDKLKRRKLLIIMGEIIAGFLLLISWFIHYQFDNFIISGYCIIIGLSVVEIFWSMSNISWSALISDLYLPNERSGILGSLTSLGGLGRIFGIFIGGIFYDGYGSHYEGWGFREGPIFFIAAGIMFISTIPMIFTSEKKKKKTHFNMLHMKLKNKKDDKDSIIAANEGYYIKIFIIFVISLFLINIGRNSISVIFSQYLTLDSGFNLNPQTLSSMFMFQGVAVIIVGIFAGKITEFLGHSKTMIIGILIAIFNLIWIPFINNVNFIFIATFLIGTNQVLVMSSSYAYASNLIPETHRGRLFGYYNATFFLSWGLGSTLIFGPLIDKLLADNIPEVKAYNSAFFSGAIIAAFGLLIFVVLEIWQKIHAKKKIN